MGGRRIVFDSPPLWITGFDPKAAQSASRKRKGCFLSLRLRLVLLNVEDGCFRIGNENSARECEGATFLPRGSTSMDKHPWILSFLFFFFNPSNSQRSTWKSTPSLHYPHILFHTSLFADVLPSKLSHSFAISLLTITLLLIGKFLYFRLHGLAMSRHPHLLVLVTRRASILSNAMAHGRVELGRPCVAEAKLHFKLMSFKLVFSIVFSHVVR